MRHELQRFGALLGKELREHRNLFVITPLVFALLLLLVGYLIVTLAIPAPAEAIILEKAGSLMANLSVRSAVIFPVLLSIPFAPALLLTTIIYLTVCLYQDRKDRSFLFWQSMPVPDWQTVLSRAVTAIFVIPAIFAVFLFFCYLALVLWQQLSAWQLDLPLETGKSVLLALNGAVLFYCFGWLNGLLSLPIIGWFLLFSAYSRRVPFLWAIGGGVVLALLETTLLDSSYFGYWMSWTARVGVFGFSDVPATLFSYQMLAALMLGSVLLAGATLMRRYND